MIKLLNLSLAAAFIGAFTFGAAAQQPANPLAAVAQTAAPALSPGSPLIGRPASEACAGCGASDCGRGRQIADGKA
jgi:hypothetical protein